MRTPSTVIPPTASKCIVPSSCILSVWSGDQYIVTTSAQTWFFFSFLFALLLLIFFFLYIYIGLCTSCNSKQYYINRYFLIRCEFWQIDCWMFHTNRMLFTILSINSFFMHSLYILHLQNFKVIKDQKSYHLSIV